MHLMLFIQMTPGVLFHFHWVNLLMVASEYTRLKPKQMDLLIAIKLNLWLRVMLKNMVLTKMKHLPVAKLTSMCVLISLAALYNWPLFQMDVNNVFQNSDLQEEVYMHPRPGLPYLPGHICLLQNALYRLEQVPCASTRIT